MPENNPIRYENQLDNVKRPFDVAKYDSADQNRIARIQLHIGHWLRILEFRYSTNYYDAAAVVVLLPLRGQLSHNRSNLSSKRFISFVLIDSNLQGCYCSPCGRFPAASSHPKVNLGPACATDHQLQVQLHTSAITSSLDRHSES